MLLVVFLCVCVYVFVCVRVCMCVCVNVCVVCCGALLLLLCWADSVLAWNLLRALINFFFPTEVHDVQANPLRVGIDSG